MRRWGGIPLLAGLAGLPVWAGAGESLDGRVEVVFEDEHPVFDRAAGQFVQRGVLRTIAALPVAAPIALALTGVEPVGTSLVLADADGTTDEGYPFRLLLAAGRLEAGEAVPVELRFELANRFGGIAAEAMAQAAARAFPADYAADAGGRFRFDYRLERAYAGNRPPLARAGADRTHALGETVVLDGGASEDPDGDALSYAWTLVSVPAGSAARLSSATSVRAVLLPDLPGRYAVSLVVGDGALTGEADTVAITVTGDSGANRNPAVTSTPPGTATGTRKYSYQVAAADADGDPLAYELTEAPAGMTLSAGGLIQWTPPNPSEHHVMVRITLRVSDGRGGTAVQTYQLRVNQCTCV